jgi:hypothetical protein
VHGVHVRGKLSVDSLFSEGVEALGLSDDLIEVRHLSRDGDGRMKRAEVGVANRHLLCQVGGDSDSHGMILSGWLYGVETAMGIRPRD